MKEIIRWALIPPTALLGFYVAFMLGMLSYLIAESFCPPELMVSEMCNAPYMKVFEKVAFVVFPTLASLIIIWAAYWLAPRFKFQVCAAVYVLGMVYAAYLASAMELWLTLVCVAFCAGISLFAQYRLAKRLESK